MEIETYVTVNELISLNCNARLNKYKKNLILDRHKFIFPKLTRLYFIP